MRRLLASFIASAILGLTAQARADLLYVAADLPNAVVTYDTAAGSPTPTLFASLGSFIPYGMAFGPSGDLFLSSYYSNSIQKVSPSGVVSTFATSPLLDNSTGLAFDDDGNLFASKALTGGAIVEFPSAGAASIFANTNTPQGLAFDQAGNLYVSNAVPNTITKFTPGGMASTFASGGGLSNPYGLAFDHLGNLFVASANNNTIFRYTPGGVQSVFASGGILNSPFDLAFDSAGNLFVGNSGNNQIQRFTPGGVGSVFATAPGRPLALAFRPVPEPGGLVMLGIGVAGLLACGRLRRRVAGA